MPENENQVAIPPRLIGAHVPSLVIVVDEGHTISVPLTASDNALLSQVRVAQLREVMDKQLALMKDNKGNLLPLKPIEMKSLVDSFAKIEDMGRFAYAPALSEEEGGAKKGREAAQMMKAMAEGVTTAVMKNTPKDREKQILELGKKKMPEVIIEQPKAVPVEVW